MTGVACTLVATACAGIVLTFAHSVEPPREKEGGMLLVANKGEHTLGIVDPVSGKQVATVAESGITGHEVAASPDGRRAWVPIYGNSGVGSPGTDGRTLDVIDLVSRKRAATVEFPKAARPHCAVFGPDRRLYVSTELTNSITVIDPDSLKVVDDIPTGQPESHMLTITRDGRRAYTSNVHVGTVSAIDLAAKSVIAVIPVSKTAQRIALTPDDRYVFTADQTSPQLAVIDTATNTVKTWIPLPGIAYGTGATPDGRWLIVALLNVSKVGVVDLQSMKLARTVDVPKAPQEVLIRPDGRVAYVSCDVSHVVAELNLATWKVDRLIDVGKGADGLAWAGPR